MAALSLAAIPEGLLLQEKGLRWHLAVIKPSRKGS